jgi:cation diffusion facilitator CzcD-associated flavoprotein CzcO
MVTSNATENQSTPKELDYEVLVVGCGFAGIGTGIKLNKIGIRDYIILETAADLGGAWRDNT